jgi:hypothetical protein
MTAPTVTPRVVAELGAEVGELLAERNAAQGTAALEVYAEDPAGFLRDVLRCDPWAKQVEMAEAVRDYPRVVCVTGNGLGKDFIVARAALWWIYARRGFVILTGPTERQVKHILMREVRQAFLRATDLPGQVFELSVRVGGETRLLAMTSDAADQLTGFHDARGLLIAITEGQGVSAATYEAAEACCTGPRDRVFAYGNPTRNTGSFHTVAHSRHWHALTVAATESPNVASGAEEIPGLITREGIELKAAEWGTGSPLYQSRVLAHFPTDAVESIASRALLERAFRAHHTETASEASVAATHSTPWCALDVARAGEDANVLVIAQGDPEQCLFIREAHSWHAPDTNDTLAKVEALADAAYAWLTPRARERLRRAAWPESPRWRPLILTDEAGMGGPVLDQLKQRGFAVEGFLGAASPIDGDRFQNKRAESYFAFKLALEHGRLALPRSEALVEECLSTEWTVGPRDRIAIIDKDTVRRQLGRSPDLLDAITMAAWRAFSATARGHWGTSEFRLGG